MFQLGQNQNRPKGGLVSDKTYVADGISFGVDAIVEKTSCFGSTWYWFGAIPNLIWEGVDVEYSAEGERAAASCTVVDGYGHGDNCWSCYCESCEES